MEAEAAASASPETLVEKSIPGPHLRPTKSEPPRVGTSNLWFNRPPGNCDACSNLRNCPAETLYNLFETKQAKQKKTVISQDR